MVPLTNLPFPVLLIAAARGTQKLLESELLFELFTFYSICRQQIGECLMYMSAYRIEEAIIDASKAAYLATLIEKGQETVEKFLHV